MFGLVLSVITPTTALVFITAFLLTYYIKTTPKSLKMPPGPYPLPIVGSIFELVKTPDKGDTLILQTLARKYGKFFSLKVGSVYTLVISDHKTLIEAFVKNGDVFSDRPDYFYVMQSVNKQCGYGIFGSNGHPWKTLRRTALATMRDFGVGKQSLEEKIQEEIGVLLDAFGQHKGKPFYTKHYFNKATSNVICQIIFGSRFEYEDKTFQELLRVLDLAFKGDPIFVPINFFPYLKYIPFFTKSVDALIRTFKTTADYVKSLTVTNEPTFDPENIRDFVDLFIKMKRENKDDETFDTRTMIRAIVDMFVAGSDTTANTLSWAMIYMAKYPEIQKKCQQEIDEVIGKGKLPSWADRIDMPYAEATCLEALRIRPVATAALHSTNRDCEFRGYHLPKDTLVIANLLSMSLDPDVFPNPEKFDPGRFLNEDGKVANRERMVAFSNGPRACMGETLARMELFMFFTAILQFYTITPEPGKTIDVTPDLNFLLKHKLQNLVFTRRE